MSPTAERRAPIPAGTDRTCRLDGCDRPLSRKQREFCCWDHYVRSGGLAAADRHGSTVANARAPRAEPPRPRPTDPPATPAPVVPELVRRLAAASETESGMRCAGLGPEEIALALRLQRNGMRLSGHLVEGPAP